MKNDKTIRWKQRFQNFKKAASLLIDASEKENLNRLEQEGMIQRFEYTFELAWKTVKDFLESKGMRVVYPRDVLKEAFQSDLIDNGEIWLEMLDQRNSLSHTYDEDTFLEAVEVIRKTYTPEIKNLLKMLTELEKANESK